MKKLVIAHGYAGTGKSYVSNEFAKNMKYAWISQDKFLFHMFPSSIATGMNDETQHKVVIRNLEAVVENYMSSGYDVVLEGALTSIWVKDPLNTLNFVKIANQHSYQVIPVKFVASEKKRNYRKQKRRARTKFKQSKMPPDIDKLLVEAADSLGEDLGSEIFDTTRLSKKMAVQKFTELVDSVK